MSPKILELLHHASHSRNEALPLEWGTEDKIAFSMLSGVLSKVIESKATIKQEELVIDSSEVKKQWDTKVEEYVLGDNGEWLPTRIVSLSHSSLSLLKFFQSF